VQNIVTRLNQSDSEFFDEQFMYGHREILLSSAIKGNLGLNESSILVGGLMHGWSFHPSVWRVRKSNLQQAPRYVWNRKFEEELTVSTGNIAIGAPWLYLLKELGIRKHSKVLLANKEQTDVLIFPGHNLIYTSKEISRQVSKYKEIVGTRTATVCLFWLDFLDPSTRQSFVDADFHVVCIGFTPRGKYGYSSKGGRVTFLPRLLELFASHELILADELGSGVIYAASLGKKIQLCPDSHSKEIQNELAAIVSRHEGFYVTADAWLDDHEPELWKSGVSNPKLVEIAWEELGESSLLSEEDLASLPWRPSEIPTDLIKEYTTKIVELKSKIIII
jgi:hypothetical protein